LHRVLSSTAVVVSDHPVVVCVVCFCFVWRKGDIFISSLMSEKDIQFDLFSSQYFIGLPNYKAGWLCIPIFGSVTGPVSALC
jgi:hypothetical protein